MPIRAEVNERLARLIYSPSIAEFYIDGGEKGIRFRNGDKRPIPDFETDNEEYQKLLTGLKARKPLRIRLAEVMAGPSIDEVLPVDSPEFEEKLATLERATILQAILTDVMKPAPPSGSKC
jgi:hypothetical protein